MEKIAENDFIEFYKIDDILYSKYKDPGIIDGDGAKKIVDLRLKISNNQKQCWCLDATNVRSFDKNARDYSDKFGQTLLFGTGVIVNSHLTKFMVNTYMRLKIPKIPFKVFTSKEKAIEWLLEIRAKSERS